MTCLDGNGALQLQLMGIFSDMHCTAPCCSRSSLLRAMISPR